MGWQLSADVELLQDNLWWLWLTVENCDSRCEQALKNLKATHILLNKEAERVRVAFSSAGQTAPAATELFGSTRPIEQCLKAFTLLTLWGIWFFLPNRNAPRTYFARPKTTAKGIPNWLTL